MTTGNRHAPVGKWLIVDDNEVFLQTLQRALQQRGYEVVTANGAEAAVLRSREYQPDRVVLDMNLAGESGLKLISRLQDIRPAAQIVVLTGYASIATAVEAIRLGAVNYLPKPVDIDEILAAFERPAGVADEAVPLETKPMTVRQLEWEHLQRVLLEHDNNISATARALGMHRRSLQRKLRKHAPR